MQSARVTYIQTILFWATTQEPNFISCIIFMQKSPKTPITGAKPFEV